MRKLIVSLLVSAVLAVPLALPATASAQAATGTSGLHASTGTQATTGFSPLCEKDSPNLCWRDPSDGGPGTPVLNSGYGTDNARLWFKFIDTARCGGFVSNSAACPFTPGSGLNARYNNDEIVYVQNLGSDRCAGSSTADAGFVYMHTCDSVNGASELASVFVLQQFSTHFRLISVDYSDGCFCDQFVNGDNVNNDQLYIGAPGTWSRWTGGGN